MGSCTCKSIDLFNYGCRCKNNPLRVWHNGIDWVVAKDREEACEVLQGWTGCLADEFSISDWCPVDDDISLTFHDGPDDDSRTTLTAKEWVEEIGKPEYIDSRIY
jgi:hypothetical protein